MRQATLKIRSYVGNISIVDNGSLKRRILYTMLWLLLILALFYVLALGNMVWNIVGRRVLASYSLTLDQEVKNLESEYLAMFKKLDLSFAYSLGFKETEKNFTVRRTLGRGPALESLNSLLTEKVLKNEI